MKIAIASLILASLVVAGLSKSASAQTDFTYAVTSGGFEYGEPDSTYQSSGTPPTALVTVEASVVWTVKNITMMTQTARTELYGNCGLHKNVGGGTEEMFSGPASYFGTYSTQILAGKTYSSYGANCNSSGSVPQLIGSYYYADALFTISDEKTGDGNAWNPSFQQVQVN